MSATPLVIRQPPASPLREELAGVSPDALAEVIARALFWHYGRGREESAATFAECRAEAEEYLASTT